MRSPRPVAAATAFILTFTGFVGARLASGLEPTAECWSITAIESPTEVYGSQEEAIQRFGLRMTDHSGRVPDDTRQRLFTAMAVIAETGTPVVDELSPADATYRAVDSKGTPLGVLELTQLDNRWAVSEIRVRLPVEDCQEP